MYSTKKLINVLSSLKDKEIYYDVYPDDFEKKQHLDKLKYMLHVQMNKDTSSYFTDASLSVVLNFNEEKNLHSNSNFSSMYSNSNLYSTYSKTKYDIEDVQDEYSEYDDEYYKMKYQKDVTTFDNSKGYNLDTIYRMLNNSSLFDNFNLSKKENWSNDELALFLSQNKKIIFDTVTENNKNSDLVRQNPDFSKFNLLQLFIINNIPLNNNEYIILLDNAPMKNSEIIQNHFYQNVFRDSDKVNKNDFLKMISSIHPTLNTLKTLMNRKDINNKDINEVLSHYIKKDYDSLFYYLSFKNYLKNIIDGELYISSENFTKINSSTFTLIDQHYLQELYKNKNKLPLSSEFFRKKFSEVLKCSSDLSLYYYKYFSTGKSQKEIDKLDNQNLSVKEVIEPFNFKNYVNGLDDSKINSDIKIILHDIHNTYELIKNQLDLPTVNHLNKLMNTKIPEIVHSFLEVYDIKNQKVREKTAENLFQESIHNIHSVFNNIKSQILENKLSKLSILNRYSNYLANEQPNFELEHNSDVLPSNKMKI